LLHFHANRILVGFDHEPNGVCIRSQPPMLDGVRDQLREGESGIIASPIKLRRWDGFS